ncbi:MAG: hypothetical protein LBK94_06750 [Prevotellaceae bacterium]|jgi:hypothetical protein|nr:hypothetical protein [Prevotellaceae bacterium]
MFNNQNQSNAKQSNITLASAHETGIAAQEMCREFIALVKQNYPQLRRVKFWKRGQRYVFRAHFRYRSLFTCASTVEYGIAHFSLEILRKLFIEKCMSRAEYRAKRDELKRQVIMNYGIYI